MEGLVFPKLSYKITGLCLQIYKEIGRFCREKQYADKFEELLIKEGLKYKREYNLSKILKEVVVEGNIVDFIIKGLDGIIIVDFKAKKFVTKEDYFQMQRYLKSAKAKLGLVVNFRNSFLKPKRVINPDYDKLK